MKKLTKKIISILLVLVVSLSPISVFGAGFNQRLWGDAYIVIDYTTGDVLFKENENEIRYPASLTKMMTAIVAYEYFTSLDTGLDTVLTASSEAAKVEPTKFGLLKGEKMTVDQALNIMLVASANDIAVIIAEGVVGSVSGFAKIMSSKAADLGCINTHFVNPHGLHDDNHYSTAADMAIIAKYFLSIDYLANIVKQDYFAYEATNKHGSGVVNTTNLLKASNGKIYVGNELRNIKYSNAEILGIKTGATTEGGGSMATLAKKDNTLILSIVLNSRDGDNIYLERFSDTHKLLDFAFTNFRTATIYESGKDFGVVKVKHGEFNKVKAVLCEDVYATLKVNERESIISSDYSLETSVKAPIKKGDKIGELTVYRENAEIGKYDLVAEKDVVKGTFLSVFGIEDVTAFKIFKISKIVLIVFLAFALVILVLRIINKSKARKKRELREKLKAQREAANKEDQNLDV